MELIQLNHDSNVNLPIFYLPHHPVIKEKSSTTKLRVVFNASCKSHSGLSLNDVLMTGPTIQDDLFSIVARFRKHKIAFTADIAKMYRQIQIHRPYRDIHRIFWRASSNDSIQCYKLGTVTYGTSSAPFLATRTLKQLAMDERDQFPEASKILNNDFYIDDVLSGAHSPGEAAFLQAQLIKLLASGGFELRKWFSNHNSILSDELNASKKQISILGLTWDIENDNFLISLGNFKTNSKLITKRSVLSAISTIFDPLGLCGPVVFRAKLYMQQIWSLQDVNWDTELPSPILESWNLFYNELCESQPIEIPRCVIPVSYKTIELHGFGDASEKGYGACIYIRTTDQNNTHHIRLLCSKSRVAPLRTQTIPRLELCAALLLSELMVKIQAALHVSFDKLYYWSDSEITLLRIKSPPAKFTTFVGNRIAQIQEVSSPNNWKFVPTEDNPADPLSRGLNPEQLITSHIWWNGPTFLKQNINHWPKSRNVNIEVDQMEYKKNQLTLISIELPFDLFEKFSSFSKLLRITALCIRFYTNIKLTSSERKYTAITVEELENALKKLIKNIQSTEYQSEIQSLRLRHIVDKKSKIKFLSPFIDDENIIRVGGRLNHAQLNYNHQHQYLLPSSHVFSKQLIAYYHIKNLHAGPQALLSYTRQKFWITGARSLCKAIVHKCLICFRSKPKSYSQLMGQLPSDRITPSRPFSNVGVDYFGPFNLIALPKSKTITKVYVAIYICFATKAIHMELVHSLSTQSFIASLHRFVSRRGRPINIYSDNATNFVGARSTLHQLVQLFNSDLHQYQILQHCSEMGINWKTIPPRSPHFGGLWEAAVKSAKHHIKKTLSDDNYLMEELETVIAQTEACLNSRPISAMSDDPTDYNPLTPGHFLIGEPLNAIPSPSLLHIKENRLSKFQRLQSKLQTFWKRWSLEYLSQLQIKYKWNVGSPNIKIGDLVLLKEDFIPPMKWILGRVDQLHPGNDNIVRVVTVKTPSGLFKRATTRICPLPNDD